MNQLLFPLLASAVAVALLMFGLRLTSLRLRDVSIVDRFWGIGFVVAAFSAAFVGSSWTGPAWLVLAAVTIWGLRLSYHLTRRNWGEGEDFRYQQMRARQGPRFSWTSLFTVFLLQGVLLFIISLPLQVALVLPASWSPWHALGVALWTVGLTVESVADLQLTRFRADPANRGRVLRQGLWRYSRHPNYFGDAVVWWGMATSPCLPATAPGRSFLPC